MAASAELVSVLDAFQGCSLSIQELKEKEELTEQQANTIVQFFEKRGILVPENVDEDEEVVKKYQYTVIDSSKGQGSQFEERNWFELSPLYGMDSILQSGEKKELQSLKFLILGGCLAQSATGILEELGVGSGYSIESITGFPDNEDLVQSVNPDVVVLQIGTSAITGQLADSFSFYDEEKRREKIESIKDYLSVKVARLQKLCDRQLILLQGFASPQVSPFGRSDFRVRTGATRAYFEINEHMQELAREHSNMVFCR